MTDSKTDQFAEDLNQLFDLVMNVKQPSRYNHAYMTGVMCAWVKSMFSECSDRKQQYYLERIYDIKNDIVLEKLKPNCE